MGRNMGYARNHDLNGESRHDRKPQQKQRVHSGFRHNGNDDRFKQKIEESETGYYIIAEILNILVDEKYLAEDGKPDMEKMNLIAFDPIHNNYIKLGGKAGNAFHDGKSLI